MVTTMAVLKRNLLLLISFLLSFSVVQAQDNSTYIDPNTVPLTTRSSWCILEQNACITLCLGTAQQNSCSATTLAYTCSCTNGVAPPVANYKNTLPYFICQESYNQCITANPNNVAGQQACKDNIQSKCGTLDVTPYTPGITNTQPTVSSSSSSTSTSSSTSSSSSSISSTTSDSSSSSTSSSDSTTSTTAAITGSSSTPTSTPTPTTIPSPDPSSTGLSTATKVAIGVTIPLVLIALILLLWFFLRRRQNRTPPPSQENSPRSVWSIFKRSPPQTAIPHPEMSEAYGYPVATNHGGMPLEADAGQDGRLVRPTELPLNPRRPLSPQEMPTSPRRKPLNQTFSPVSHSRTDPSSRSDSGPGIIQRNRISSSPQEGVNSHHAAPGFAPYFDGATTQSYSQSQTHGPAESGPSFADDEAELEVLRKKIDRVRAEKERMGELESMEQQLKEQIMAMQRRTMAMEGGRGG